MSATASGELSVGGDVEPGFARLALKIFLRFVGEVVGADDSRTCADG